MKKYVLHLRLAFLAGILLYLASVLRNDILSDSYKTVQNILDACEMIGWLGLCLFTLSHFYFLSNELVQV